MKKPITEERILQISNNVSEEFTDHGQTDFATRAEFCQVVQYWQRMADENWNKYQGLRMELVALAFQHVLRPNTAAPSPATGASASDPTAADL